jgi:hypothetical protein
MKNLKMTIHRNQRAFKSSAIGMLLVILICTSFSASSQTFDPRFQSVFIYGIAQKVDWASSGGVFRIAIIGENPALIEALKKLAETKKIDNRDIKIEVLKTANGALSQDIVFLTEASKSQISTCVSNASKNTLVITEFNGAIEKGSHLNFISKGNKIAFELNRTAINSTNLKVKEDLISLASSIN